MTTLKRLLPIILGSFALSAFVGVALPALIYSGNASEFQWTLLDTIFANLSWVFLSTAILSLIGWPLNNTLRHIWLGVISGLLLSFFAFGLFMPGNLGLLDGSLQDVVPTGYVVVASIVFFAFCLAIGTWLSFKAAPIIPVFSIILCVVLTVQSYPELLKGFTQDREGRGTQEITALSSDSNVIVVLFDTMQSDFMQDVLRDDSSLATEFEGFTLYDHTLGAAPTTYLSMPAIHAGRLYEGDRPLEDFYTEEVRDHSFLVSLARAGYDTTLVNSIKSVCPNEAKCLPSERLIVSKRESIRLQALRLVDVALYRSVPHALKSRIYNDGRWLVQQMYPTPDLTSPILKDIKALSEATNELSATSQKPKALFLHLMQTHPPYLLSSDCTVAVSPLELNGVDGRVQTHCALKQFASFLNKLRALDIYDSSTIVLLADHGTQNIPSTRSDVSEVLGRIIGSANPALAVKNAGATGQIKLDHTPRHISDVSQLICASIGSCETFDLFKPDTPDRRFAYYVWRHEFWLADYIDNIRYYDVKGDMFDPASWVQPAEAPYAISVAEIDPFILAKGWNAPEDKAVWSDGDQATLLIPASGSPSDDVELGLTPFAEKEPIGLVIRSGDLKVFGGQFDTFSPVNIAIRIPNDNGSTVHRLDLEIRGAKSPASIGFSNDQRRLGVALRSVQLVPSDH